MNKKKFILKVMIYIIIALIAVRLLSSTLKFAAIIAIIACSIYFVQKGFKE